MRKMISPEPLSKGDIIGIIAPAGQITDTDKFDNGIRILREMGFEPLFPRELWPGYGYLSDTDKNRAYELMRMVSATEVKGIIAARGGYGCLRMLKHLDFDLIRKRPKPIIGFSDLTVLLDQIVSKSGMIAYHGPVVTSLPGSSREALERFFYSLTGNYRKAICVKGVEILRDNTPGEGRLVGGNLSSLLTLTGTTYDQNWRGSILFLEDVNEPLYKVDRMLTQLALSDRFKGLHGLILGDFSISENHDSIQKWRYTEAIWNRILELTENEHFPVWGNFPVGHFSNNLTLPLGAYTRMENQTGMLSFL